MPNTNDIHIDAPLVRELIKAQFPEWANLKIKPVEFSGWDNRTFHLDRAFAIQCRIFRASRKRSNIGYLN